MKYDVNVTLTINIQYVDIEADTLEDAEIIANQRAQEDAVLIENIIRIK